MRKIAAFGFIAFLSVAFVAPNAVLPSGGSTSSNVASSPFRVDAPAEVPGRAILNPSVGVSAVIPVVGGIPVNETLRRFRLTTDGMRFAALIGTDRQDVEIASTTAVVPITPSSGFVRERQPVFSARIVSFVPRNGLTVTMAIDGIPIPAAVYDPASGTIGATAPAPLAEGRHLVSVLVHRGAEEVAAQTWEFHLDSILPMIQVDTITSPVHEPSGTISGTVSDASPVAVEVNGQPGLVGPSGRFSATVALTPGSNPIQMVATDAAGNTAVASVSIDFEPRVIWFAHPAHHFRIVVPFNWSAEGNVSLQGASMDVLLVRSNPEANIFVSSEARAVGGSPADARAILQEGLDNLSGLPGFLLLSPVADRTIDGHAAATVTVTWQPSTYNVVQILMVVVGPEFRRFWALGGTMFSWDTATVSPEIEATFASFEILEGPGSWIGSLEPWLLVGASVATAAEGGILGYLILRGRRRPH